MAADGGYFSLGGINSTLHNGEVKYISMEPGQFHKVLLNDIIIEEKVFDIPRSYFTIIDSGTTISYFPNGLYNNLMQRVNEYCSRINKCLGDSHKTEIGQCYKLKENINLAQFIESMPNIKFEFENNIVFNWKPENYLFNNTENYDKDLTFCMGFTGWR